MRAGGRPARPRQEEHAHTHTRDPGVASSDREGEVSASTRNSPGAPAESPVERRTVRETGCVSDRVHTHQTTAAQAAQDRSQRDLPGTTPSRGPERVRRGARPAPLPRQGPAAGTKSPVLGRPPRAPRSHPVKPGATAPGVGEGTTAMGQPTGAPRATRPDEARASNAGPQGTPQRHAGGHNHGTRTGAKTQGPPGAANPGSTHSTRRTAAQEKVPRTAGPHARTPHPQPVGSGPRPHARKDEWSGVGELPAPDAPHQGKRRPPRAPSCRPYSAQSQRARARCGDGDGSPRRHPPHPQPVGSGPRPHAPKDGRSGVGDRPTPKAPPPVKRRPHRAPSCRLHSAPGQLARAHAAGLVTGPHARTPRTHSQWIVGPGRTPQRTGGQGSESA